MHFNAEKTEENILSTKRNKPDHPILMFGGDKVVKTTEHKHMGIALDEQLDFQSHIKEMICRARKGMGLIWHVSKYLSRHVFHQIHKLHV